MNRKKESGKTKLFKGGVVFLWEELKTMNTAKLRSLGKIIYGYALVKWAKRKRLQTHAQLDEAI